MSKKKKPKQSKEFSKFEEAMKKLVKPKKK